MPAPWIVLYITSSAALTLAAGWQWGLGGAGLALSVLTSAGIGYLARSRLAPSVGTDEGSTLPPDSLPSEGAATTLANQQAQELAQHQARLLALSQRIVDLAQGTTSLSQAMHRIGEALHAHLGSRAWVGLRVEGWNGESALLRPWVDTGSESADLIDVSAIATVHRDDPPLGTALHALRPTLGHLPLDRPQSGPWREACTRQVLAVPIVVDRWPVALLEFDDPRRPPAPDELDPVLHIAAAQLGFVAQREAQLARMASSTQHLGRLAQVATRISSGVAITDRDGVVEWVNSAFTALTGWPDDKVVGRSLPDLMAQEEGDQDAARELRACLQRGTPFRMAFEAGRKGPQTITRYWGEIDAIQMLDEAGGRGQYVCLFNDITRRQSQERIREQEREFLEALLGNLPVSLFVLDPVNFNVVAVNRYTEIEFDLKRDSVVGRPLEQSLGHEAMDRVRPRMAEAIDKGGTIEHDVHWDSPTGPRTVNARHFALRHANGRPRLLISLLRDITKSRQAQWDLEESERRFRELVESMDDLVYVATEKRQQFHYLSPRTNELLGLSADSLMSSPQQLDALLVSEDREAWNLQAHQEVQGFPTDAIVRLDVPGKGLRWMRHRTRPRRLDDGQVRVYGLLSDVTDEHTQALELQRARDAAESASQAKSQFMANMSHEIRTPMNGILGMTELLLGTSLNDKQRRFAQAVYRSGESLLEIINDILDFAKIEAGRLELATCDFVLRTLVEDTLELMAPRAHEKGLELSFREQPGLPSVIHGDPLRLRQVLTNLVANAIKFTEHGEVVVDIRVSAAPPASAEADPAGHMVLEFIVRDTGIGIATDALPRLFSAFIQAHGGMARRYGGTGLGLAISKQLVELMGGQIDVHSAPGVGSEFMFSVPVRTGDSHADMAMLEEPDMPAFSVLVVDDNETNRTVIENMLSAWGMHVEQARNGREALEMLMDDQQRDQDFDLALVDMNMPELDGIGLARAVRGSGRYPQLKMVLLSSVSSPDDVRRAQEAGFQRFVPKPLRKAELRQAILGITAEMAQDTQPELPKLHKHVLVVEDNPVNQEVCTQMLKRLGCDVRVASSALEGLRRLGEARFDLILMDIQMPGMDGVEALDIFRRGSSSRFTFLTATDTPVVAVTANALEGDEDRFLGLGFDDYLSKPFRQSQLQKVLMEHLRTDPPSSAEGAPSAPTLPPPAAVASATHERIAPSAEAVREETPTMDPLSLFDQEALRRLKELDPKGDNRLFERVASAFETSVGRLMPQFEDAIRQQDMQGILHVAHTLKSSSASIGALKLSQMCAEIETMIRRQTGEDLSTHLSDIPQEVDRVLVGLRCLLEQRP